MPRNTRTLPVQAGSTRNQEIFIPVEKTHPLRAAIGDAEFMSTARYPAFQAGEQLMHNHTCCRAKECPHMPHSARSVELIEPPRQPYARQAVRPDVGVDLFAAFLAVARRAARPRPRRRRGHPGRRRGRHGGPAAPGLPRRRAGPAPAVRAAAHAATARSLAACAAIPAWVTLRPGGQASSPGYSAPTASLALMVPAPTCSQRAEVRRPVSSPPCERARYLCTRRNTHWRYPGLAGDRRRVFSIVLIGNQIADLVRLTTGTTKRAVAHRTSTLVWSIGLAIDGL